MDPGPETSGLSIRAFRPDDEDEVVRLWRACGLVVPWNDPHEDMARKTAFQSDLFLVGELAGRVAAAVMAGYEGHRGWINYLAVDPVLQGRGLGGRMMSAAEEALKALGCPKINLMVRRSNRAVVSFYERLGFRPDDVVCLGKKLV
ncbi:MAG: GNAT family acetyltransferase [Proteobacteria bacterium]|nr:GNAT family acetyltransferase [Pseudomonadota bacterium]